MVKEILTASGFVENKTFRETRFLQPPKETYAVYNQSIRRRGADNLNLISEYDISIEVYEYAPDPKAEASIEAQLDNIGQQYEKAERYWIESEQLYQVIYNFSYMKKEVRDNV